MNDMWLNGAVSSLTVAHNMGTKALHCGHCEFMEVHDEYVMVMNERPC